MYVGTRRHARNCTAKGEERYSLALQVIDQGSSLGTIWMQGDINRVMVIVTKPVVRG